MSSLNEKAPTKKFFITVPSGSISTKELRAFAARLTAIS